MYIKALKQFSKTIDVCISGHTKEKKKLVFSNGIFHAQNVTEHIDS